jgi:hypothetical protein
MNKLNKIAIWLPVIALILFFHGEILAAMLLLFVWFFFFLLWLRDSLFCDFGDSTDNTEHNNNHTDDQPLGDIIIPIKIEIYQDKKPADNQETDDKPANEPPDNQER